MTLRIIVDADEWDNAIDAHRFPNPITEAALSAVMQEVYRVTQLQVHVITGSLKNSGRVSTSVEDATWEGELSYGGPSPGFPNDPVRYAQRERQRGGDHDFLLNVSLYASDISEAMFASVRARGAAS